MSSLLVINRVYRLEIQSVMLVFSTSLWENSARLPSLQVTSSLPCVNKYWSIHSIQCVTGGGGDMVMCI
jgi:hypothetical protein